MTKWFILNNIFTIYPGDHAFEINSNGSIKWTLIETMI